MPPSQLKTLKASLRAEGILGPQKSKKQKGRNHNVRTSGPVEKADALRHIRDQFNPFEYQLSSRANDKFQVTRNDAVASKKNVAPRARPGITKGLGEENRRRTLLAEISRRKKVGGVLDKRFGENDPTMTPEERTLQRFTKEQQRRSKNKSLFDLEADEDGEIEDRLTHFGQSISFDRPLIDDFREDDLLDLQEAKSSPEQVPASRKRKRGSESEDSVASIPEEEALPERPKTKAEVMSEVIAKSKLYKFERQKAKEDDEDIRDELDNNMPEFISLLKFANVPATNSKPRNGVTDHVHPERAIQIDLPTSTKDSYDKKLKELAFDKRSLPTNRTKTDEEKTADEAEALRQLEKQRNERMQGNLEQDDISASELDDRNDEYQDDMNDAKSFGLLPNSRQPGNSMSAGLEDEDDFLIEEDLVALESPSEALSDSESDVESTELDNDSEELDFLAGLDSTDDVENLKSLDTHSHIKGDQISEKVYPCPGSHHELLSVVEDVPVGSLISVVQRIRALHHPRLDASNKKKLGILASVLIEHIKFLANTTSPLPLQVIQELIRHVHSLAKTFAEEVGNAFRLQLRQFQLERSHSPEPGDLMLLTAIGSIFPTSDRFHTVTTPAALCITRYLACKAPTTIRDLTTGTYLVSLILKYQTRSKRFIPEALNYTLNALASLAPEPIDNFLGPFLYRESASPLRFQRTDQEGRHTLDLACVFNKDDDIDESESKKPSLLVLLIALVETMTTMWIDKTASCEMFTVTLKVLRHLQSSKCRDCLGSRLLSIISRAITKAESSLSVSRSNRRPLELHHHRPLPIKMSIPKFEESYNPDKHYDPDRERSETNKLKAEYKKERKGALRELRKDANFIARESLREKRQRDADYEKKFKRLVAEIQGEEGKESNLYEREKRLRKGRK